MCRILKSGSPEWSEASNLSLHIQISCSSHLNHLIGFALRLILRPSTKDIIRIRSCTVSTHRHAASDFLATSIFDDWTLYTSPRPTLAYLLNSNLGLSCAVVTYTYSRTQNIETDTLYIHMVLCIRHIVEICKLRGRMSKDNFQHSVWSWTSSRIRGATYS